MEVQERIALISLELVFWVNFSRTVEALHKFSKSITERVGLIRWNVLGREHLCCHARCTARFLHDLDHVIVKDGQVNKDLSGSIRLSLQYPSRSLGEDSTP